MTNNKQQTAVEFYLSKIFDIIGDDILDKLSIEQINKIHDLSIQAKQMEKKQIAEAYWNGSASIFFDSPCQEEKTSILKMGEQYYNETYTENNDK